MHDRARRVRAHNHKGEEMKGQVIGHIECKTCGFGDAQVKVDKNGNAYGFCPDCTQQWLTHGGEKDKKLRARMRPVSVTVTEPAVTAPPVPLPTEAPVPSEPTVPPASEPPVTAKRAGWIQPVMGRAR